MVEKCTQTLCYINLCANEFLGPLHEDYIPIFSFYKCTVAAEVMSQSTHTLKRNNLSLKFVLQKEKEKFLMNQLIIHGLPDGTEKGVFELIIADCLEIEDFQLVINADSSSAVITFTQDYSAKG